MKPPRSKASVEKPARKTRRARRKCFRDEGFLKRLGQNIRRIRTAKGYSIDRIYLESGTLSRATLSHLERGMIDPRASTLQRIAEVIGVPVSKLMDIDKN